MSKVLDVYMRRQYDTRFINSRRKLPRHAIHISSTYSYMKLYMCHTYSYMKLYMCNGKFYRVCQYGSYTEIARVELV
jgi:hypothetical protein